MSSTTMSVSLGPTGSASDQSEGYGFDAY